MELVGAGTNLVHPGGESVWSSTNESSAVTFDKIVINYYLVFAGNCFGRACLMGASVLGRRCARLHPVSASARNLFSVDGVSF